MLKMLNVARAGSRNPFWGTKLDAVRICWLLLKYPISVRHKGWCKRRACFILQHLVVLHGALNPSGVFVQRVDEPVEEVGGVMGAGGGLRVVLD